MRTIPPTRLSAMSNKRQGKAAAVLDSHASGIRGEYETHGAEQFYQSQGSAYSNPHEEQLKIGVPRCFNLWKDRLPSPIVRLRFAALQLASSVFCCSCSRRARCWT